ncbi:MAG: hypothetical protein HGA45_08805 [Chloroflexales bacterium]|nr:hypothetical protein [Chloroflexales bacterium]
MSPRTPPLRIALIAIFALLGLSLAFGSPAGPAPAAPGTLRLQAPALFAVAQAQEGDTASEASIAAAGTTVANEAGIAAYFQAPGAISLDSIRARLRTVEADTSAYILGTLAVPEYGDNDDVKAFASSDGWVLVYYLKSEPASKIFDYKAYDGGSNVPTKFDRALTLLAGAIGTSLPPVRYYHFNFPNATNMLMVTERTPTGEDSFQVTLPGSFTYAERSWSLGDTGSESTLWLNGARLGAAGNLQQASGVIAEGSMLPDQQHTLKVVASPVAYGSIGSAALTLIYRVP